MSTIETANNNHASAFDIIPPADIAQEPKLKQNHTRNSRLFYRQRKEKQALESFPICKQNTNQDFISTIPPEIILQIMGDFSLDRRISQMAAICLGLTSRRMYRILKDVHPDRISLALADFDDNLRPVYLDKLIQNWIGPQYVNSYDIWGDSWPRRFLNDSVYGRWEGVFGGPSPNLLEKLQNNYIDYYISYHEYPRDRDALPYDPRQSYLLNERRRRCGCHNCRGNIQHTRYNTLYNLPVHLGPQRCECGNCYEARDSRNPHILPNPFGKSTEAWEKEAIQAIEEDISNPRHRDVESWALYWWHFSVHFKNRARFEALFMDAATPVESGRYIEWIELAGL